MPAHPHTVTIVSTMLSFVKYLCFYMLHYGAIAPCFYPWMVAAEVSVSNLQLLQKPHFFYVQYGHFKTELGHNGTFSDFPLNACKVWGVPEEAVSLS